MGRDFFHTDRKGVTNKLIKKTVPPFHLPQYIQTDSEPLPDLGIILGKWFGFPRSWLKAWNSCVIVRVYMCVIDVILPKIINKRALFN